MDFGLGMSDSRFGTSGMLRDTIGSDYAGAGTSPTALDSEWCVVNPPDEVECGDDDASSVSSYEGTLAHDPDIMMFTSHTEFQRAAPPREGGSPFTTQRGTYDHGTTLRARSDPLPEVLPARTHGKMTTDLLDHDRDTCSEPW